MGTCQPRGCWTNHRLQSWFKVYILANQLKGWQQHLPKQAKQIGISIKKRSLCLESMQQKPTLGKRHTNDLIEISHRRGMRTIWIGPFCLGTCHSSSSANVFWLFVLNQVEDKEIKGRLAANKDHPWVVTILEKRTPLLMGHFVRDGRTHSHIIMSLPM